MLSTTAMITFVASAATMATSATGAMTTSETTMSEATSAAVATTATTLADFPADVVDAMAKHTEFTVYQHQPSGDLYIT